MSNKQIEHEPAEDHKLPDWFNRDSNRHIDGSLATPADALYKIIPIALVLIAVWLWS